MKPSLFLTVLLTGRVLAVEVAVPAPLPDSRYEKMVERSPFALATPAAPPPAAPQASFAANWFVSGIARSGDKDFVTIKARDLSTQFSLYGNEPNLDNGVSLASIDWSDTIGKSTVIIKKGTETAKLEFNEAELRGPVQVTPQPGAGAARPGGAPMPGGNVGAMKPGSSQPPPVIQPRVTVPRPSTGPVVAPPIPSAQPPQAPGVNGAGTGDNRRRIRQIGAPQ